MPKRKPIRRTGLREQILRADTQEKAEAIFLAATQELKYSYPPQYIKRCLRALKRRGHG